MRLSFADAELKFDKVEAESLSQHIKMWHLTVSHDSECVYLKITKNSYNP